MLAASSDLMGYLKAKSMSKSTCKVFTNPSTQRFTCSPLTPLESTNNYLSQLNHLLQGSFQPKSQTRIGADSSADPVATVMEDKLAVSIQTPTIQETGSLARIHLAAFKDDRCTRLMYSDSSHWKAVNTMVETRYSHADFGLKLAVTKHEGRVVGWICCSLIDSDVPIQDELASLPWTIAAARLVDFSEERLTKTSGIPENKTYHDRRRKMYKVISDAYIEAMSQLLNTIGGTKQAIINTLAVDPACKSRGVGSELLRWATEYADSKGIAVWAQIPTAANGMFEAAGFEDVHTLVLDLDDYYYGEEDKGKPVWGVYEIKYMARKARDPSETGGKEASSAIVPVA